MNVLRSLQFTDQLQNDICLKLFSHLPCAIFSLFTAN